MIVALPCRRYWLLPTINWLILGQFLGDYFLRRCEIYDCLAWWVLLGCYRQDANLTNWGLTSINCVVAVLHSTWNTLRISIHGFLTFQRSPFISNFKGSLLHFLEIHGFPETQETRSNAALEDLIVPTIVNFSDYDIST